MIPLEMQLAPTGNAAVDALQAIQLESLRFTDDNERKSYITREIGAVPCDMLIDRHLRVVSEGMSYANDPEEGRLKKWGFTDLSFHGVAASLNYEKYHGQGREPVKSIMISFVFPIITAGVPAEKVKNCYDLALRLPVMAVKTCIDANIA